MKILRVFLAPTCFAFCLCLTASAQTAINANNFAWQCGPGKTTNCPIVSGVLTWPTTTAMPNGLRLHDSGTEWSEIEQTSGTYTWTDLDAYLDALATHQPRSAAETFTSVPCWDAPPGSTCPIIANYPHGTNAPPSDLTSSGSPTFNAFVTAFVQHCSAAGNCVKKYIKGYDMWNEWDLTVHWTGTVAQLYEMIKPAVSIIRTNVSGAVIMMPSTTPAASNYECDFASWLAYETSNGRISDWVNWHLYLSASGGTTHTPEAQWALYAQNYLNIQTSTTYCGYTTSGWSSTPWVNTETNFSAATNYTCPSSQYNNDDCTGQIARWQLLHDSNGAAGLYWYYGNTTIGNGPASYATAYYYLQQYLIGGTFTAPCSYTTSGGFQTWTCGFTESGGKHALFVWACSETSGTCGATTTTTTYTVPTGYIDYKDLSGGTTTVSGGSIINIGSKPFMLEK